MSAKLLEQNSISQNFDPNLDLHKRQTDVTNKACDRLHFRIEKLLGKSSFWDSELIGAIHYLGDYEGQKAVLKIQGIKMYSSEVDMIREFEAQNTSKVVRPPKIYAHLEWSDIDGFEAYVMEYIEAKMIIGLPAKEKELKRFFEVYQEYRKNCLNKPWVRQPAISLSDLVLKNHEKWKQAFLHLHGKHPFRSHEDEELIYEGLRVLTSGYKNIQLTFQHGHFSRGDVKQKDDGDVILFSNLLWSWKMPFYDAVFAYHWSIYQLSWLNEPTPELVESQRKLWLNKIYAMPASQRELKLLNLALLERALGGLRIDAFTVDIKSSIAQHLVEAAREQVRFLIEKNSNAQS